MRDVDFEKLLKKALQIQVESQFSKDDFSDCLSDEVIRVIYERTLPEAKREEVIEHLSKCERCCIDLKFYFDLMEETKDVSEISNVKTDILTKIVGLLSLPLKNPSCWDKLKELCNQLVNSLSEFEGSRLQGKKRLSLVTSGYGYTQPSATKKSTKNAKMESQEKQEIGKRVLSLLEMLGDDEIAISKRIELSEELLLYAEQKSKELKGSSSSQKADKPYRKEDND